MTLLPHQEEVVRCAVRRRRVRLLLADDTGTGKTRTAAAVVEAMGGLPALVLCPKSVLYSWEVEWGLVNPESRVVVLAAPERVPERLKGAKKVLESGGVVVTNYETVSLAPSRLLAKLEPVSLILDEAHRIRNHKTKVSKRVRHLAKGALHVLALTATPFERRPSDLWGILASLRPDVYSSPRGRTWHDMVAQYEVTDAFGSYIRPKNDAWEVLSQEVRSVCLYFHRRKSDLLDLPPLRTKVVRVPFEPEGLRVYRELVRWGLSFLEEGRVLLPSTALSLMQRLRLVCETVEVEPFNLEAAETPARLQYLLVLLETVRPVVVFTEFRRVVDWLQRKLKRRGLRVVRITGQEKGGARQQAIRALAAGKADVCLCTYGAGGEGLNLQTASHLVVYGLPLSYTKYYQAVSRVYRAGSRLPVAVHVLRNEKPRGLRDIERTVLRLIADKAEFRETMMEEWLKGGDDVAAEERDEGVLLDALFRGQG